MVNALKVIVLVAWFVITVCITLLEHFGEDTQEVPWDEPAQAA